MIPGLEQAEFLRYGSLHRNTFINSPQLLRDTLQFKARGTLFFAGQLVGVRAIRIPPRWEGSQESTQLVVWLVCRWSRPRPPQRMAVSCRISQQRALVTFSR